MDSLCCDACFCCSGRYFDSVGSIADWTMPRMEQTLYRPCTNDGRVRSKIPRVRNHIKEQTATADIWAAPRNGRFRDASPTRISFSPTEISCEHRSFKLPFAALCEGNRCDQHRSSTGNPRDPPGFKK